MTDAYASEIANTLQQIEQALRNIANILNLIVQAQHKE
jgi:hypothetical protein